MKRLLLSFAALAAYAQTPAHASPREAVRAFDTAWQAYQADLEREGVLGGAVLLLGPDGFSALRLGGIADRSAGRLIDAASLYHWASVTKVFTAIAAMQLVERGRLSLDDPVVRYVPEFRHVHNPHGPVEAITIRHLLTHSAGLRGATWPWNMDGAASRSDDQPHEPADWSQIEAALPYTAIQFAPGTRASYSNLGLSVLGRVVEVISGEPLQVYVDKNILTPLGMEHSYFDATPWHLRQHRVRSYSRREGQTSEHPAELMTGATVANGGLNGSIQDMGRFVRFLMGDPGAHPILRRETLRQMLQPQLEFQRDERRVVSVGLGFFVTEEREAGGAVRRYFGHSGFQRGHRSALYISEDGCCAFVFAANTATSGGNPSATNLRVGIVDRVFPQLRQPGARSRQ